MTVKTLISFVELLIFVSVSVQCFAVFSLHDQPIVSPISTYSFIDVLVDPFKERFFRLFRPKLDETTPLLSANRVSTAMINYKTTFLIPYEHVLRDDRIIFETSNTYESNATETQLLFSDIIANESCETGKTNLFSHSFIPFNLIIFVGLASFSFDDEGTNPVVLTTKTTATKTNDGHILVERILQINHATAVNPSTSIQMRPLNQKKTRSSSTINAARPFDEFLTSSSSGNNDSNDSSGNSSTSK